MFLELYDKLEAVDTANFNTIEGEFFLAFYNDIPREQRPNCVTAFMVISTWMGSSLRSGVWTYYEAADQNDLHIALQYLKENAPEELESMFSFGIHDYQNPAYKDNYNYPESWLEESEQIDNWISENEAVVLEWQRNLLLNNKSMICSL